MDEFDFTDGLKIVLVSIFLLGSVQLHALIDESSQHADERAARMAEPSITRSAGHADESLDAVEARAIQHRQDLRLLGT